MQTAAESKQLRQFGFLLGGIIMIIALWPLLMHGAGPKVWAVIVSALLVITGAVAPQRLRPVYRVWMAFGDVLGRFNSIIILSLTYYAVITPMGFVMRLLGKDPMHRRFERETPTYRVTRQPRWWALGGGGVGQVERKALRSRSKQAYLAGHLFRAFERLSAMNRHIRPGSGQFQRDGATNSARCSRHTGNLSRERCERGGRNRCHVYNSGGNHSEWLGNCFPDPSGGIQYQNHSGMHKVLAESAVTLRRLGVYPRFMRNEWTTS